MHPMFVKLFLEPDADDLLAEEDERRTLNRSRRTRSRVATRITVRDRDRPAVTVTSAALIHATHGVTAAVGTGHRRKQPLAKTKETSRRSASASLPACSWTPSSSGSRWSRPPWRSSGQGSGTTPAGSPGTSPTPISKDSASSISPPSESSPPQAPQPGRDKGRGAVPGLLPEPRPELLTEPVVCLSAPRALRGSCCQVALRVPRPRRSARTHRRLWRSRGC